MSNLSALARRASELLKAKKEVKQETVKVKNLDGEITIQSLNAEILDRTFSSPISTEEQANRLIYASSPELKSIGKELEEAGQISDGPDVVALFSMADKRKLLNRILALSGLGGKSELVFSDELDAVKN